MDAQCQNKDGQFVLVIQAQDNDSHPVDFGAALGAIARTGCVLQYVPSKSQLQAAISMALTTKTPADVCVVALGANIESAFVKVRRKRNKLCFLLS